MKGQRQGGLLIAKVHQLAGRIFAQKLKEVDIIAINPAQGRILFALWQRDGISIHELARQTALDKSTLTRMLDRLEEGGQINRFFPANDRRKTLIYLTEENRHMKECYDQVSNEMNELFYRGVTEAERDMFEGLLQRILENLAAFERNDRK